MHSFTLAGAGVSDQAWSAFAARSALSEACEALDTATGMLGSLAVDSEWRSDGIAALHRKLAEFRDRTIVAVGDVHETRTELGSLL